MALLGTYIIHTSTDTGATTTETVSYPADLPITHENYEKRGTTEDITVPVVNITSESIDNTYLMVTGATLEKWGQDYKLGYAYRLYPNTDTENIEVSPGIDGFDSGSDNFTHKFTDSITWSDSLPVNLIEAVYEDLKVKAKCANMSNA
jgi:hypothetical protein